MIHSYLGVDIGSSVIRLALVRDGAVQKLAALDIPAEQRQADEILPDEVARALRTLLRREQISVRRCALVLPLQTAFVRRLTLPWMTAKQLKLNLPYEFHDYIEGDPDNYVFDYAFVGQKTLEDGTPVQMELLAAVSPKEVIARSRAALRKVGLKLSVAVPEYLTYRKLISAYETANPEEHPREYCIIDMGGSATRVHMYRGTAYETTQIIEQGSSWLEQADAGGDASPGGEGLRERCNTIAIDILRAINFYGFNTPGSDLRDVYLSSGITENPILTQVLQNNIPLRIHTLDELLPDIGKEQRFGAAVGAALELMGR